MLRNDEEIKAHFASEIEECNECNEFICIEHSEKVKESRKRHNFNVLDYVDEKFIDYSELKKGEILKNVINITDIKEEHINTTKEGSVIALSTEGWRIVYSQIINSGE